MTTVQVKITTKTPPPPLYQLGDDFQVFGTARGCASGGCPAVVVLHDQSDTEFTRDWQFFLYAVNPGVILSALIAAMSAGKALFNSGGLSEDSDPRANYLSGSNLSYRPPKMDKLRSFNLNTHTGVEVYNLTIAILSLFQSIRERSFTALKRSLTNFSAPNALLCGTFDGNAPPPMKPGCPRPQRLEDIRADDYLYTPWSHRWMFLDCTNVRWKVPPEGPKFLGYGPWANGSLREWIGDGKMHTFFPLVSRFTILSPLRFWNRVTTFPSPFRQ